MRKTKPIIFIKDEQRHVFTESLTGVSVCNYKVNLEGTSAYLFHSDEDRVYIDRLIEKEQDSLCRKLSNLVMNHIRDCLYKGNDSSSSDIKNMVKNYIKSHKEKNKCPVYIFGNSRTPLKHIIGKPIVLIINYDDWRETKFYN